jgi:hypothetical protein
MHIKKAQKRDFQNEASVHRAELNNVDNSALFLVFCKKYKKWGGG